MPRKMDSRSNILQLCRLCLVKEQVNIDIFNEHGEDRQIFQKISSCLPVKVSQNDKLPKRICDGCSYKLDMCYEFCNLTVKAEQQLLKWLEDLPATEKSNDVQNNVAPNNAKPTEAIVKEEQIDPSDVHKEEDDKDYVFAEKVEENNAGPSATVTQEDEPPPKRQRRTAAVKAAIAMDHDSDDDDDSGEPLTKMEDESDDSDGEDNDPSFADIPSTSADDQPGPSGVGKEAADAPLPRPKAKRGTAGKSRPSTGRCIKYLAQNPEPETAVCQKYTYSKVFMEEQAEHLINHIENFSYLFFTLSLVQCCSLSYQVAIARNVKVPRLWIQEKSAPKKWFCSFRQKFPNIDLGSKSGQDSESLKNNMKKTFFENLEILMTTNPVISTELRIYNVDEFPIPYAGKEKSRVIQKEVTDWDRASQIKICAIIGADGTSIPPVVVFPDEESKDLIMSHLPSETLGLVAPDFSFEEFREAMRHFVKHTNSSILNPSILIMDTGDCHVALEALDIALASGVHVHPVHPAFTVSLQPINQVIYPVFRKVFDEEMKSRIEDGCRRLMGDVGPIMAKALSEAMTQENIRKAFLRCGIPPICRNFTQNY